MELDRMNDKRINSDNRDDYNCNRDDYNSKPDLMRPAQVQCLRDRYTKNAQRNILRTARITPSAIEMAVLESFSLLGMDNYEEASTEQGRKKIYDEEMRI